MPVILPAGCRVCGSGIGALYYDKDFNLRCRVCDECDKKFFENLFKNVFDNNPKEARGGK